MHLLLLLTCCTGAAYAALFYDPEHHSEMTAWGRLILGKAEETTAADTSLEPSRVFSRIYGDHMPSIVYDCKNPLHVALSFDDGISSLTESFLAILDGRKVPATFFIIANSLVGRPQNVDILVRMAQKHTIGSHSFSHKDLLQLDQRGLRDEIKHASETIFSLSGVMPRYFRPPYSNINEHILNYVESLGMKIVMWNIDTNDWCAKDSSDVIKPIENGLKFNRGLVILQHDRLKISLDSLPHIIELVQKSGRTFVRMEECVGNK